MIRIETELFISATPEKIWEVLMDFDKYPEWNPFVLKIKGEQEKGAKLDIHVRNPDASGRIMRFYPKILILEDNKMFAWKGRFFIPGIFDGVHYFRLVKAGEGTLLIHGEAFKGILANLMRKTILGKYPKSFEALNLALAKRVG